MINYTRRLFRALVGLPDGTNAQLVKSVGEYPLGLMDISGPLTERTGGQQLRIGILPAANGKIVEVGRFKPNPKGPDWMFEHHIVPSDKNLVDVVTQILVLHALDQS